MGVSRRHRSLRRRLKALFYRLSVFDAMEDEVESEQAFGTAGLAIILSCGGIFLVFLLFALCFIITSALGWRVASSVVPLL